LNTLKGPLAKCAVRHVLEGMSNTQINRIYNPNYYKLHSAVRNVLKGMSNAQIRRIYNPTHFKLHSNKAGFKPAKSHYSTGPEEHVEQQNSKPQ